MKVAWNELLLKEKQPEEWDENSFLSNYESELQVA